jgi:hypothetical protein
MDEQKSLDSRSPRGRAMAFCQQYGLRIPILQAPMAGSCPVSLAVAVADGSTWAYPDLHPFFRFILGLCARVILSEPRILRMLTIVAVNVICRGSSQNSFMEKPISLARAKVRTTITAVQPKMIGHATSDVIILKRPELTRALSRST